LELASYADLALLSLGRYGALEDTEQDAVTTAVDGADVVAAGSELLAEGQALRNPKMMLAGWAARVRILSDGRRQIISFVVPGDVFGLCSRPRGFALTSTVALTTVCTAPIDSVHWAMVNANGKESSLALAGWGSLASEETLLVANITRLGRQSAYERLAHLFLELYHRLHAVELASDYRFALPLTQEVLSDALGLSVVHTNRTLQHLRRDGFVDHQNGEVRLDRADTLAELVDFRAPAKFDTAR
jgi:CRP-like cAMP-binding protein